MYRHKIAQQQHSKRQNYFFLILLRRPPPKIGSPRMSFLSLSLTAAEAEAALTSTDPILLTELRGTRKTFSDERKKKAKIDFSPVFIILLFSWYQCFLLFTILKSLTSQEFINYTTKKCLLPFKN